MKLFDHQIKYAKGYKDTELVVHEGGTGKTVCACVWLKDGRDSDALVVCPKRVVKKWEAALVEWGAKATVMSKDAFKKTPTKKWSAVVVDEADEFASPLFIAGRSALATSLYNLVRTYPSPILLLTATPIRSNPWNLHTLLCYKGHYIDWEEWRKAFFVLTYKGRWSDKQPTPTDPFQPRRPYLAHPSWLPREDWRARIRYVLERHADIVLLRDCIKDLPPETTEEITVESDPFIVDTEWTPTAAFVAEHKNEQLHKAKHIIEIGKEFRKVLVVAYYTDDCERLERELSKDRKTYMANGNVKDQEKILLEANNDPGECYLVVQASLGVGFDADTFSAIVFTSMSYGVRDWVQMKWRARRIHNLHPIKHYYLLGGRCDAAVLDNVKKGKEFIPSEWDKVLGKCYTR